MCFSPWKDFDNLAANDPALTQTPQENVPASNNLKHLKALILFWGSILTSCPSQARSSASPPSRTPTPLPQDGKGQGEGGGKKSTSSTSDAKGSPLPLTSGMSNKSNDPMLSQDQIDDLARGLKSEIQSTEFKRGRKPKEVEEAASETNTGVGAKKEEPATTEEESKTRRKVKRKTRWKT